MGRGTTGLTGRAGAADARSGAHTAVSAPGQGLLPSPGAPRGDDGIFGDNWPMLGPGLHRRRIEPGAWAWILGVGGVGLALFASLVVAPWLAERLVA